MPDEAEYLAMRAAAQPHSMSLQKSPDRDAFDFASCVCGWIGPLCPDQETAAGFWADHLVAWEVTA